MMVRRPSRRAGPKPSLPASTLESKIRALKIRKYQYKPA